MVCREDTDPLRFLLWSASLDEPPSDYKMAVGLLGRADSPCIAAWALQRTAADNKAAFGEVIVKLSGKICSRSPGPNGPCVHHWNRWESYANRTFTWLNSFRMKRAYWLPFQPNIEQSRILTLLNSWLVICHVRMDLLVRAAFNVVALELAMSGTFLVCLFLERITSSNISMRSKSDC